MDVLLVGNTYDSYEEFILVKKRYEKESNTMLTLERSFKLKDGRPNADILKAGSERPTKSSGIRESSTNRQNFPFKLRIGLTENKIQIKE